MDAVLVVLLAVFAASEANPSSPNRTCTESGIDCVFPFVFGGKQYNSCIAGSLGAWCGIKAEVITSTRNVDFSYCLKKCPIKNTECTTQGYKCIWPYIDEHGHNHTSCVHYHSWFGSYYWCPIVSNYTGGPLHGKCADSCPADGPKVYTTAPQSTAATTNPGTTTTPTAPTPKTTTLPTTSTPTTSPTATASKTTTLPTAPTPTTAPTASAPKSVTTTSPPTAAPTVVSLKPAATTKSSTTTTSRNPKIVVHEEPTVKTPEPAAVPSSVSTTQTSSTQTPVPTTSSTIIVSAAGSTSLKPDTSSEAVQPPANNQPANGRSAENDAAPKHTEGDSTHEGTQSTTVAAVPTKSNATILLVCLTVLFALVLVATLVYLLLRKRRQRKEKAKAGAANKEKVIPLVEQHSLPNGKSHEADKIAAEPSGDSGAPLVVDESSPDKVRYVTTDSGFGSRGNFAET